MPIPIAQLPSLDHLQIGAPQTQASDYAGSAGALNGVGKLLSAAGGALAEKAAEAQKLQDAFAESDFRGKLALKFQELDSQLDLEPDPQKFEEKLNKTLQDTSGMLSSLDVSDELKQRLQLVNAEATNKLRLDVLGKAASLTASRARDALQNELQVADDHGDAEAYASALDRAGQAGLVMPEQRDKLQAHFDKNKTKRDLAALIGQNPDDAMQVLTGKEVFKAYPALDEESRNDLLQTAVKTSNKRKAQAWDTVLVEGLKGNKLAKEDVLKLAEEGSITPEQAGSYIRAYHASNPPTFDPLLYNMAHSAVSSYDPKQDPTGAGLAMLQADLATIALPKESLGVLKKKLNEAAAITEEKPVIHRLSRTYSDRIKTEWNAEAFGNWYSLERDNKNNRISRKIITEKDFGTAVAYREAFKDSFFSWLRQQPDTIDPLEVDRKYDELKRSAMKSLPPAKVQIDTIPRAIVPTYKDPLAPKDTKTSMRGTFGGQDIPAPGMFIRNAGASVFGGDKDPIDNGLSANGGSNNAIAGVAIPQAMLQAMFPGKDNAWHFDNVKVVVKTPSGATRTLPLVDYGTAEWVAERAGRHVLDLNPKAVAALGGQIVTDKDGKQKGLAGIDSLSFAVTTDNAANLDPKTTRMEDLTSAWFTDKKPIHPDQVESGLAALLAKFYTANS